MKLLTFTDIGLKMNRQLGCKLYQPGELFQVSVWCGETVWIEVDRNFKLFRIGFGDHPTYGNTVCLTKAKLIWRKHVQAR